MPEEHKCGHYGYRIQKNEISNVYVKNQPQYLMGYQYSHYQVNIDSNGFENASPAFIDFMILWFL
jgi:hypothetical protein